MEWNLIISPPCIPFYPYTMYQNPIPKSSCQKSRKTIITQKVLVTQSSNIVHCDWHTQKHICADFQASWSVTWSHWGVDLPVDLPIWAVTVEMSYHHSCLICHFICHLIWCNMSSYSRNVKLPFLTTRSLFRGVHLTVHCILNCIIQNVKMTLHSTALGHQMPLPGGGTSAFSKCQANLMRDCKCQTHLM